jgi:exosortase/archaeosortase
MSALAVGGIVFGCVFGGTAFGMVLGAILPQHHLSVDSKDVIKVAVAMIATLAALVVGLLISSAKSSFDDKDGEMRRMAARAILLDRTMAEYGPETQQIRDRFREILAIRIAQIWPEESKDKVAPEAI